MTGAAGVRGWDGHAEHAEMPKHEEVSCQTEVRVWNLGYT